MDRISIKLAAADSHSAHTGKDNDKDPRRIPESEEAVCDLPASELDVQPADQLEG